MRVLALLISMLLTATCFADSGASFYGSGHGSAAAGGCAGGSDGQIGYATMGGDKSEAGANRIYYSYYTPTEDGTVTYAHAWKLYNSGTYQIGIFSQTGTLLTSTGSQTGGDDPIAEVHASVDSYCLVAATTYIVGFWRSDAWAGPGTSAYIAPGPNVYAQDLAVFGSFTPSDTVSVPDRYLTVTLNNSADTF